MRVATMALMDGAYYLLALLVVALALLSRFSAPLAYIAAISLVFMFVLLFWSIPLKLNWSANLYGHLLRRFLSFLVFMLLIYGTCYYMVGVERCDGTSPSFLDAVYFSVTTFTTVQYGEFRPLPASRPLVCVESLMGIIAFVPFFAAFGWLYCQNRLWPQSLEDKATPEGLSLQSDSALGGWREVETERTRAEAAERNARVKAMPCVRCGSTEPTVEKIYDIIGRTSPLPLFVVHCSCGQITKPSTTAFLAVWRWARLNARTGKTLRRSAGGDSSTRADAAAGTPQP